MFGFNPLQTFTFLCRRIRRLKSPFAVEYRIQRFIAPVTFNRLSPAFNHAPFIAKPKPLQERSAPPVVRSRDGDRTVQLMSSEQMVEQGR
jgi:hypothetical protein